MKIRTKTDIVLFRLREPKAADTVVFRYPLDHGKDFVKGAVAWAITGITASTAGSRGSVKRDELVGKAEILYSSHGRSADLLHRIRWERIGRLIK